MTSNATSAAVRDQLIQALELDLVGPSPTLLAQLEAEGRTEEATELREELLDRPPNRWYQSGFLIPSETSLGDRADDAADDEFAGLDGQNLSAKRKSNASGDDTGASEAGPARQVFFTCSVGLSVLIPAATGLEVTVHWASYKPTAPPEGSQADEAWLREPHTEQFSISAELLTPSGRSAQAKPLPGSDGLMLRWHLRAAPADQGYPPGAVAVSLFLTNERSLEGRSAEDRDRASAYQVQLDVGCSAGFLARHDPRAADLAINANDWDHRINNLHYRGDHEFAVGHNISVAPRMDASGRCHEISTTWLPQATVEKVLPRVGKARLRLGCAGGRLGQSSPAPYAKPATAGAAAMSKVPPAPTLSKGCVVHCRSHHHLVEEVVLPEEKGRDTVVRLACLDDDANGQITEVFWEREVDARILGQSTWETIGQRGFDDPRVFSSYLHTLQWNCVTATDPGLFQAPLRAGIDVKPYQLEPLRKALRMPRVALFIADDVGLGKTIEAGLIMRELLLRQKAQRVVVVAPPSVVLQWQGEMESRFGLPFQVMNREYVSRMRRERGWGINPWATHTRFILSQALVRNEDYAGPLRDWLGDGERALLILDEAHNAAPASGSKIAVDSKLTRAIRGLALCFEHKLFLSATPHNGHSNSFSALLEILDPTRFCRGVPVRNKADLEPVLVRRLKEDLRRIGEELPKREVVPVVLEGLDPSTPELELARLLKAYRSLREQRLKGANSKQRAAELLVVTNLQKRLLSSIEAFHRTLGVHCDTLRRRDAGERLRTARDPQQLRLLQQGIDGDDERAEADEDSVEREAEQEHRLAVATAELGAGPEEWTLLKDMQRISERARYEPDARIHYLRRWIQQHLCPDLGQEGAKWNSERLLIFTEYADTKRWLQEQIESLIAGSDRERERIATFHGGIGDEKREALKRSFNSPPEQDPLRILIATDAAREGVNLQNHCRYLFHFDVPWNPGRMEQRNGRIDRTLQRAPEVFCHYFVLADREEDRVLDVLVKKTEEIRKTLGSLPPVIVGRLNELLAKGINPTAINEVMAQIQGVDQEEGYKRRQALVNLELEDNSREREDELRQQVARLEKALQKSEDWLHFSSDLFRDALNTSLRVSSQGSGAGNESVPQLKPRDPAAAKADPERAEWIFPAADELPGGEQSWGDVLDALRRPRQPGEKLWEWRRNTVPQPVVFKDPKEVNADRVHLHLEHPLVQRLLNRFLVRGFQGEELSRAAVIATHDDTAKLILLARLSLYGHGAARLHDEVLELVAEWDPADPARRLRVLNATKTDMALADLETSLRERLPAVNETLQRQLRTQLPADVAQLKDRLEALAAERAERAKGQLSKRAEDEANTFVKVLQEQRERILKTRSKHDSEFEQLAFGFADHELRQLRDNRSYWDKRLARIERDLELEPDAIRRTFEVATAPRIDPAGAIVLWPLEAAR